ncbi:MAG: hotdog fold thioesterase [Anaerolineales bacterium]|jgi:1,4-dihydroxy-2-naphthoyl-CoA hydrolase
MPIWNVPTTAQELNQRAQGTMLSHLGIEFLEISEDSLKARMPVDERTIQPAGILHGGASATLAESLGSVAANLCVDPSKKVCVGLDINANHVRSVNSGWVIGIVTPIHVGKSTHVWQIRIEDEAGRLVCIARITMAVLDAPNNENFRNL